MKSAALFGGSFDPPHLGHIAVVDEALRRLDVEKVIIVPAYLNPFKSRSHAPAELRLKWLRAIFAGDERISVSDFEIAKGRAVPSIETVEHFRTAYDRIYFIVGADNLEALPRWHRFADLDNLVTWVVAARDGGAIPERFVRLDVDVPVSSTRLRERMDPAYVYAELHDEIEQFYKEPNGKKS